MAVLVTGDDISIEQTLTKNGVVFSIDSGATIQAAMITRNYAKLVDPVSVLEATVGSDWGNSHIIIEFPEAATTALTDVGPIFIEIQVNDGGKLTWFSKTEIVKGTIDQ